MRCEQIVPVSACGLTQCWSFLTGLFPVIGGSNQEGLGRSGTKSTRLRARTHRARSLESKSLVAEVVSEWLAGGSFATLPKIGTRSFREVYCIHETRVLGTGMSGDVVLGQHIATGRRVVVKRLRVPVFASRLQQEEAKQFIRSELAVYMSVDHPHIAKLHEVYEDTCQQVVYLVMEYAAGGELYGRLEKNRCLKEVHAQRLVKQMLLAISYLHRQGVVHRDLKLENWVFSEASHMSPLLLIDFGLSTMMSQGELLYECLGTSYYCAPEVVLGDGYDYSCDMWSLGVTCYMMLAGDAPFEGETSTEVLEAVQAAFGVVELLPKSRWAQLSPACSDFVRRLLTVDPNERMNAEDALNHPWIAGGSFSEDEVNHGLSRMNSLRSEYSITRGVSRMSSLCSDWAAELDQSVEDEAKAKELTGVFGTLAAFSSNATPFQKACCGILAQIGITYSHRSAEVLLEPFFAIDTSVRGAINERDFTEGMSKALGIPSMEARRLFKGLALSESHQVLFSDFVAAATINHLPLNSSRISRLLFKKFDTMSSGRVTVQDIAKVIGPTFLGRTCSDMLVSIAGPNATYATLGDFRSALGTDIQPYSKPVKELDMCTVHRDPCAPGPLSLASTVASPRSAYLF